MNDLPWDRLLTLLPPHLAERSRLLSDRPMAPHGELVPYWMHHAVRGHENPALDAAIWLANALRLPVLVYQGLGGRHRFNSDRHHTFTLEGARDAHRELKAKGVRALFHLGERPDRPSPLRGLAQRAAVVVVEDYPAPPFPAWTERLAQRSPAPVIAVDCCCLVPMQAQPKRFSRAFDFRRSNQRELERRLPLFWPEMPPAVPAWFDGGLGFDPLDLEQADIAEVCARCAIDHGVPAVPHTPGGSQAGYARWEAFRDQGLRAYARERNDAAIEWPRGVSRLSPYLHHGQVSPFRIAREAHAVGGDGAEKFLDELLVWRELAFNFCFHTKDPERIEALPDWAQATLREHASDPRPVILDPESLARSRTDDALWDLAQTSLRIHGELHNNLRMTWAKAIIPWRPDPQAALDNLIELNHRYALDGSDPNSYGGLLWTLGLFDRGPIAWAARNSSKPGRRGNTWVVHATPDWTRTRLNAHVEAIAAELTSALATHTGIDPTAVTGQSAHRWLYSLAENPLDAGALWEPDLGLAVCGDWCQGTRIEGAYLSGQAAAGRVLSHLAGETRAAEAGQPAHTTSAKSLGC